MEILRRKTEEVSYALGETDQYEDQSKDILNSNLNQVICGVIAGAWGKKF